MKDLIRHDSCRGYLAAWLAAQPARGHGQRRRIAEAIGMQSSMLSQILSGAKVLSADQACKLCVYFGFSPEETSYFLNLSLKERATGPLLAHVERELAAIRKKLGGVTALVRPDRVLDSDAHARYYSAWYYAAIRTLVEVPEFQTPSAISARLRLPLATVTRALKYLVQCGFCELRGGRYRSLGMRTVGGGEYRTQLLGNWRVRMLEQVHLAPGPGERAFSGIGAVSAETAERIRHILGKAIQESSELIRDDKRKEKVFVLNIDWAELR